MSPPTELIIRNAKKLPRKAGKAEYIKSLKGDPLTRGEAIRAMCFICVGGEPAESCTAVTCPLLPFCQWNRSDSQKCIGEGKDKGAA